MQTTGRSDPDYEALIIGGGPAGLSAALQLGRSLRSVLVCDNNEPRNGPATEAHGYLTRDGIEPMELRRLGREEVAEYGGDFRDSQVITVKQNKDRFISTLDNGETYTSQKIILATGVIDVFPDLDGFEELWGNGVYHCPYCHGYEVRGEPLGVHVNAPGKLEYAKLIYNLSENLVVFTDGQDVFDEDTRSKFLDRGIDIEDEPITALNGFDSGLESVSLADGCDVPRHALFYAPPTKQHSELIKQLGLPVDEFELVETARSQPPMGGAGRTSIEGVFVAGDASNGSSLAVPSAVAEGSEVGATVNAELSSEAFEEGW